MKTKNKIPMRQCTGCREMKNKKEMIRVLKTAEDEIILDATGKTVAEPTSARAVSAWRKPERITDWSVL